MNYTVTTSKSLNEAVEAIEKAAKEHKYGVLHIHDIKGTLNEKGVAFANECKILDICNPHKAKELLSTDMLMSMALPCKISIYVDNKETKISVVKPTSVFPKINADLQDVAKEVEDNLIDIINQAK